MSQVLILSQFIISGRIFNVILRSVSHTIFRNLVGNKTVFSEYYTFALKAQKIIFLTGFFEIWQKNIQLTGLVCDSLLPFSAVEYFQFFFSFSLKSCLKCSESSSESYQQGSGHIGGVDSVGWPTWALPGRSHHGRLGRIKGCH